MADRLAKLGRLPVYSLVVILIAAASFLFYREYRLQGWPEQAIQLDVSRDEAAARSAAFVQTNLGQDVSAYSTATIWGVSGDQKTYLEKELGVERTAGLANDVNLWGFVTRYFVPLQKEEFQVMVAPDGHVSAYWHLIDEAAPGARLSHDEALQLADTARREMISMPGEWRLVDGASTDRPARRDWRFTWERTDIQLPSTGPDGRDVGKARLDVVVQGDQIGAISPYLKVPEGWTRDYEQIRSANNLVESIDRGLALSFLMLAALIVCVRFLVKRSLHWKTTTVIAIIGGVLQAADILNSLPASMFGYNTTVAWPTFLGMLALGVVIQGLTAGLTILLFGAAGEALYRSQFPRHLSLAASFSWRGWMTRSGSIALGLGALMAFVEMAYQLAYYLAGREIGFWIPAAISFDSAYTAVLPWLEPLPTAYNAGIWEEFAFRLFAIPLLTLLLVRVIRRQGISQWLAIGISAFVWSFLHSHYPQDPFYARGLELGLAGIFLGWLMVRYGILASIAAHYTMDAFYGAAPLDNGASTMTLVLAYSLVAIPLAISAVGFIRAYVRGGFVAEDDLVNGAEQQAPIVEATSEVVDEVPTVGWRYPELTPARRMAVLAIAGVGLVVYVGGGFALPFRQTYPVSQAEAAARADAVLVSQSIDPSSYQRVVSLDNQDSADARAYLRENAGRETEPGQFARVYGQVFAPSLWHVRYFRPLERDEYDVLTRPDAAADAPPFRVNYDLGEDTPGARLPIDDARQRAQAYVQGLPAWQGANLTLVDEQTQERTSRTDYTFTFERDDARLGDATIRANVSVVGDHVSRYMPFVKVPEEWQRAHSATGMNNLAAGALGISFSIALIVLACIAFVRLARQRRLSRGRTVLVAAGVTVLASSANILNTLPTLYKDYGTTTPVMSFLTMQSASNAGFLIGLGLFTAVAVSFLLGLWGAEVGPAVPTENRIGWAKETVLLSVALSFGLLGLGQVSALIDASIPFKTGSPTVPSGIGSVLPGLAIIDGLPGDALVAVVALIAFLLLRRALRSERLAFAALLILPTMAALPADNLADGIMSAARGFVYLLLIGASARWLVRANLAVYLSALAFSNLVSSGLLLVQTNNGWLIGNGLVVLAIGAVGLFLFVRLAGRSEPGMVGPSASDEAGFRPVQLVA